MDKFRLLLVLIATVSLLISSCSNDDNEDCTAPQVSENIVGTWNTAAILGAEASEVTFNADKTGMDNNGNGALTIDCLENTISNFTWEAKDSIGSQFVIILFDSPECAITVDYEVIENSCDKIILANSTLGNAEMTK